MDVTQFEKLAPFARRSGAAITGRERLLRLRAKLEFVLLTEDISANSRREIEGQFNCPVVTFLTSADVARLFGYHGTKVVGFTKSSLSHSLLEACQPSCQEGEDAP